MSTRLLVPYLVSEDFLCRDFLHRSDLLERLHVDVAFVAEDDVAERLVGDVLVDKLHEVLQRDLREHVIHPLLQTVVVAQFLGVEIAVDDVELCHTVCLDALDLRLLGDFECLLRLRHVVHDAVEGGDAVRHLVVLGDDAGEEEL